MKKDFVTTNIDSGSGNKSVNIVAGNNTGASRSTSLKFTGGGITKTLNVKQNKVVEPDALGLILPLINNSQSYSFMASVTEITYNHPLIYATGHVARSGFSSMNNRGPVSIYAIIQDESIITKLHDLEPLYLRRIVIHNTDFPAKDNIACQIQVNSADIAINCESDKYLAGLISQGLKDHWDSAIEHIDSMSLWNLQIELLNKDNIGMIVSMEGFI